MKKIIIIIIFLLCGCNKTALTSNVINQIKKVEYAKKVFLYELIEIEDGKILTANYQIDTTSLGPKKIDVKYEDSKHIKKTYTFYVDVVDETPPIVSMSSLSVQIGQKINLEDKIICGDNYDRTLKCLIEGEYDLNKLGTYNLSVIAIDTSGNETKVPFTLSVVSKLNGSTSFSKYKLEDLIKNYKTADTMIGIDVSVWQEDINWVAVKKSGIEFAMIRIGFGQLNNEITMDSKFKKNLVEAKQAGIKVGVYFYSYAKNNTEALKQAKWIVEALNGETLDLPIAFDWEIWTKFKDLGINFYDLNNIAKTFLEYLENNGYEGMLYGSAFYLNRIWNLPEYNTWLAHYTKNTNYPKPYYIWQLSNIGEVDGINANVDLDILYKK